MSRIWRITWGTLQEPLYRRFTACLLSDIDGPVGPVNESHHNGYCRCEQNPVRPTHAPHAPLAFPLKEVGSWGEKDPAVYPDRWSLFCGGHKDSGACAHTGSTRFAAGKYGERK